MPFCIRSKVTVPITFKVAGWIGLPLWPATFLLLQPTANMNRYLFLIPLIAFSCLVSIAKAQIGKRFPSERKVVKDPVTGTMLTFLTSTPLGRYQNLPKRITKWTSDGEWLIFRSKPGQRLKQWRLTKKPAIW